MNNKFYFPYFSILKKAIPCLIFLYYSTLSSAQITSVKYSLKYNVESDVFDGYLIVGGGSATSVPQRTQFNAVYSIVVPTGTKFHISERYMPLQSNQNYAGTVPCEWKIVTSILSPEAKPNSDFYAIVPTLSPTAHYNNLNQGDTIKLFSIKMDTIVGCASDIRLFKNDSDPDSSAPGMQGSDYSNGFTIGGINQLYVGNVIPTQSGFAGENITMCAGSTEILQVSPEGNGVWKWLGGNPPGGDLDSISPLISSVSFDANNPTGIYSMVYDNQNSYDLKCIYVSNPTAKITGDTVLWQGCTTEVTAEGGVGYFWSTADITKNIIIFGSGIYRVTVTDVSGCTATASVQITQNYQPNLPGGNLCVGNTFLLPEIPSGQWTSTNPEVATVNPSGEVSLISAGNVTFKFEVNNTPCAPETGEFTVHAIPIVNADNTSICTGNITILSPPFGGTWSSSNPSIATVSSTGSVSAVSPGNVTFTFTQNITGCMSSPLELVVKQKPVVMITGSSNICVGGTTNLSSTTEGNWVSNNVSLATVSIDGIVTGVAQGTVTFTFTSTEGCRSTTTPVTVNPRPTVVISGTNSLCISGTTQLVPSVGGIWTSSNPSVATVTNSGIVTGISNGIALFSFTENITGCVSSPTLEIEVYPKPEAMITGPSTICAGGTTMLTPSSGGTWSSSNPGIATVTNKGLVTAISAGTVTFIYTKTQTGCSSVPILITVSGHTMISVDKDTVEINKMTKLNHTGSGIWVSSNPNIVSILNNSFARGLELGTTSIYFIDTISGCQSKDFPITVIDPVYKIIGYAFRDVNGNGIFDSQTDSPIPNCAIRIPTLNSTYYTDKTGYYRITIEPGEYDLIFSVPFGQWANNSIQKNIKVDQSLEYLFVGFVPTMQEADGLVNINGSFFNCNTLADLDVSVFNNTSQKQSGYLSVEIDNKTFVTETQPFPVGAQNNILIWEYIDLLPGHTFTPKIKLDIPIPATDNDSLSFKAYAWSQPGDTLSQFSYIDKINCGITSSGILSWPDRPGMANITYRNENLEYLIRFENEGTSKVKFAEVMCQLDKNIDVSNIIIKESSHKVRSSLVDDKLYFYFDTINLTGNRSFGSRSAYISFSCGFKKDVPDGTVISNTALVSFDGGQPFATNQTINTIVTKAPCYTKDVYAGICPGEVYVSGQEVFSVPGTYFVVNSDNTGCDSLSTIFLQQFSAPSGQITRAGNSLTADPSGVTFTWYECDSNVLQFSSTEPEFSPTKNGRYYAVISGEDCDTKTECLDFILSSSEDETLENIALYPSPTTGILNIQTSFDIRSITIQDIHGHKIETKIKSNTLDISNLNSGVYFLFIDTPGGIVSKKIVKINE